MSVSEHQATSCPIECIVPPTADACSEPRAASFGAVYREHYGVIAGLIYRRTGDVHVTEDLTCDVFLAAYAALPRFRNDVPLIVWLRRIAHNRVNRWVRRETGFRAALRRVPLLGALLPTLPACGERPPALRALLRLPVKQQELIAAHYLDGLSLAQTGRLLSISPEAVKSRLARARRALRAELERENQP